MTKATVRLACTYLAIIMVMTVGFSFVIYNVSVHQLGRQLPPNDTMHRQEEPPEITNFLRNRIDEGRHELLRKLLFLNIGSIVLGSIVSYGLARRSLWPIEAAMAAQAQFVSDASHELRTPLTAIQTSNEVFLRRPKPTLTAANQLIAQNTEDVIRLKELSDNLLQLASGEQTKLSLTPTALQHVVSTALTHIVAQATAKDITVQDKTADIQLRADAHSLARVLVIVLDNAVKYSPTGSTVTITSRVRGRNAFITVRDQGIGIRASDLEHIFRRFYRADNARTSGGYGLGLPIARQLMQAQRGDLTATSHIDNGSSFTLKAALAEL